MAKVTDSLEKNEESISMKDIKLIGWNHILYQIYLPVGFSAEMFKYFESIGIVSKIEKIFGMIFQNNFQIIINILQEYESENKDKFKIFKTRSLVWADLIFADMATQRTMQNAFKNERTLFL